MIYQLYFRPEQRERLFKVWPYRGFGLEPDVNPLIATNCDELRSARNRNDLCEYGAMLHLWRNPPDDGHDWIGFTSYRQLEKTDFAVNNVHQFRAYLDGADVLSWGTLQVPVSSQAEDCFPGYDQVLRRMFDECRREICPQWYRLQSGLYANYWAMKKIDYVEYMSWSLPFVNWLLAHRDNIKLLSGRGAMNEPLIGCMIERLVMIWIIEKGKFIHSLAELRGSIETANHGYFGRDLP